MLQTVFVTSVCLCVNRRSSPRLWSKSREPFSYPEFLEPSQQAAGRWCESPTATMWQRCHPPQLTDWGTEASARICPWPHTCRLQNRVQRPCLSGFAAHALRTTPHSLISVTVLFLRVGQGKFVSFLCGSVRGNVPSVGAKGPEFSELCLR